MDFFTASIIAFFLMVSGGMVKGYFQYNTHPTNKIKNYGHLKNEVETYKSKISGKDVRVIHYQKTNIYKVLDDELIQEFTEFNQQEFFKYYE